MNKINSPSRRKLLQASALSATAGALGALPFAAHSQSHDYGIEGQEAPEIRLDYWIDGDGKETSFSVKENAGKWVFLKFFQNWCPGCHASGFPSLQKVSKEFYGHPKVAIAGVQTVFEGFQSNRQEHVRELQQRYDLPCTMGHDAGTENSRHPLTMINYRSGGTPWIVIVNPEGFVEFNYFHLNIDGFIGYLKQELA